MTETEWLSETQHPRAMLEELETPLLEGRISLRRWQLLKCAFGRRVWDALSDERSRLAIESAERYADGLISREELVAARTAAWEVHRNEGMDWHREVRPEALAALIAYGTPLWYESREYWWGELAVLPEWIAGANHLREREFAAQCQILRDVFGNPFRPVAVEPGWLTWNHGTVPAIARRVYGERRFEDLPILADALEDAGCADADLLAHCRGPGPHVRGCWAVDLLLGKS
jgi:hypothetical protein